mmetsp:Transcript_22061/g.59503  ORF Transcript_22061/g.59503 Transcript_22061/m.59503 type:complete len:221 (+) Transcript_22061:305-967(+)
MRHRLMTPCGARQALLNPAVAATEAHTRGHAVSSRDSKEQLADHPSVHAVMPANQAHGHRRQPRPADDVQIVLVVEVQAPQLIDGRLATKVHPKAVRTTLPVFRPDARELAVSGQEQPVPLRAVVPLRIAHKLIPQRPPEARADAVRRDAAVGGGQERTPALCSSLGADSLGYVPRKRGTARIHARRPSGARLGQKKDGESHERQRRLGSAWTMGRWRRA